jgi:hypothetical protein
VTCAADDWHSARQLAAGVDELCGVHQATTLVTLVPTRVLQQSAHATGHKRA